MKGTGRKIKNISVAGGERGAEICGWKEWGKVERLQEKYIRWLLGMNRRSPGYMVREEGKREKMKTRLGRRAMGYEERLVERRVNGRRNVGRK